MFICLNYELKNISNNNNSTMADERTYIMVKPDGVQRGLVGEIIGRFEKRGFILRALKQTLPSEELLKNHYSDLS